MRIRIVLDLKNIKLSVDYRSSVVGLIYNMLPISDDTLELHNSGKILENRKYKLFTFSEIYGSSTYDSINKKLIFSGNACFDFTSFDENIIINIIDYLDNNQQVLLQNQIIKVVKYDILNEYDTTDNIKTYYTLSPITIYKTENNHQIYFSPLSNEFKNQIISNLSKKYYICYKRNMPNIEIIDICDIKKKIIKFRNTIYESYHLKISFNYITKEVHNVIMSCGLGPKNSIGFGMVSVKNEKKNLFV